MGALIATPPSSTTVTTDETSGAVDEVLASREERSENVANTWPVVATHCTAVVLSSEATMTTSVSTGVSQTARYHSEEAEPTKCNVFSTKTVT